MKQIFKGSCVHHTMLTCTTITYQCYKRTWPLVHYYSTLQCCNLC